MAAQRGADAIVATAPCLRDSLASRADRLGGHGWGTALFLTLAGGIV